MPHAMDAKLAKENRQLVIFGTFHRKSVRYFSFLRYSNLLIVFATLHSRREAFSPSDKKNFPRAKVLRDVADELGVSE